MICFLLTLQEAFELFKWYISHSLPWHRDSHYSVTHTEPKAKEAVLPSWESLQEANIGHRSRNLPSFAWCRVLETKLVV